MVILLSGGCGFIGSHLVDQLIAEGHEVVVVDNLFTGKMENLNPKAIFYQYDVVDKGKMEELFKKYKFDWVFHLAAAAKIPWCTANPGLSNAININATVGLLELAKEYSVKAFIYSSSSSIYGPLEDQSPIVEENKANPISLYGLQKYASERYCSLFGMYKFVPTISLRYFNVYGTQRQSPTGPYANVMAAFIRDNKEKGEVTVYGSGKQRRDYVHVFDVVKANILAAELITKDPEFAGDMFNIGTGISTSVNEIVEILGFKAIHSPARQEDPLYSCAWTHKAEMQLGFKAEIQLKRGIEILLNKL